MDALVSDARSALRALAASRTIVALAVLCLSIGIGANTMIFTVVDGVILEPPPFADPDRLVSVGEVNRLATAVESPASVPDFVDWQTSSADLAEMAAVRESTFAVGTSGGREWVDGALVTPNYFSLLGIRPVIGRTFVAAEEAADAEPVVVLSEALWRAQFGADREIIGHAVNIDDRPALVIGVVANILDARVPNVLRSSRAWLPLHATADTSWEDRSINVVARLAPGVSIETATARLDGIASRLAALHSENRDFGIRISPYARNLSPSTTTMILLMMGSVSLVLMIACANVANLLLASATRRRHEFAIRAALGAARWRIVRQLLCESLFIAALGAAIGLVLAKWSLTFLLGMVASSTGTELALSIDMSVLAYTVALTLTAAVLFGLAPALHAARESARAQLSGSGFATTATRRHERTRRRLVTAQVAFALALLIPASLFLRSFMNLVAADGGIETEGVTSVHVSVLEKPAVQKDVGRYLESTLAALSAAPGTQAVGAANLLPLRGGGFRSKVDLPGGTLDPSGMPAISYGGVSPDFFGALGIPLLQGRTFGPEGAGGRVAVVNKAMADRLWPSEDPIGKEFRLAADARRGWITVIGVSGDVANWDSSNRPLPTAYVDANSLSAFPTYFFVRKRSGERTLSAEPLTRAIASLKYTIGHITITPMNEVAQSTFWRQRLFSLVLTAFGVAALTLTAVGIYGVLAFLVWERAREIGIRMALGAERKRVLRMVLSQAVEVVSVGVAIGLGGAYAVARIVRGMLFGVAPFDAWLFLGVTAILTAVAFIASLAPAFRAARINPSELLRD